MVTPTNPPPKKSYGKTSYSQPVIRSNEQWLPVNIVLGMPQRNCQYHGICRIELDDLEDCYCPRRVGADIRLLDGQLEIRFRKGRMAESLQKQHFASGHFIVLTDYTLPEPLVVLFGASPVIRRGLYPIRETEDYYLVYFS